MARVVLGRRERDHLAWAGAPLSLIEKPTERVCNRAWYPYLYPLQTLLRKRDKTSLSLSLSFDRFHPQTTYLWVALCRRRERRERGVKDNDVESPPLTLLIYLEYPVYILRSHSLVDEPVVLTYLWRDHRSLHRDIYKLVTTRRGYAIRKLSKCLHRVANRRALYYIQGNYRGKMYTYVLSQRRVVQRLDMEASETQFSIIPWQTPAALVAHANWGNVTDRNFIFPWCLFTDDIVTVLGNRRNNSAAEGE